MPLDWRRLFADTLNEDDYCAMSEAKPLESSLPYGGYPIDCPIKGVPYSLNMKIKPPSISIIYW
jgi:hypothetical protein